jgi:vacuolar-type H+-ATPase subunit E/Vma4
MITLNTARARDALASLNAELLRRAALEADRLLADANAEARDTVDRAQTEARTIIENARAAGAAQAEMAQVAERARARRAHRSEILAAQQIAYEQLRRRATDAVRVFRDQPGYAALRDRLAARAVEVLGTDAVTTEDPAGGIVAEGAGRRLDLSLTAFAARAFERIEADIDGLWS